MDSFNQEHLTLLYGTYGKPHSLHLTPPATLSVPPKEKAKTEMTGFWGPCAVRHHYHYYSHELRIRVEEKDISFSLAHHEPCAADSRQGILGR